MSKDMKGFQIGGYVLDYEADLSVFPVKYRKGKL
jgi:hypothetical protein